MQPRTGKAMGEGPEAIRAGMHDGAADRSAAVGRFRPDPPRIP